MLGNDALAATHTNENITTDYFLSDWRSHSSSNMNLNETVNIWGSFSYVASEESWSELPAQDTEFLISDNPFLIFDINWLHQSFSSRSVSSSDFIVVPN